jgi:hypothetical protein
MAQNPFADESSLATVTDEKLAQLKAMSDDELLRSAQTLDQFSVIESSRRLRRATERLTYTLIAVNVLLVALICVLVWLGLVTL